MKKFGVSIYLVYAIAYIAVICILSGLCWQYTITSWSNHLHKPVDIKLWQYILIGFVPVIGQLSLPLAVGTWIVMFFV